MFKKLFDKIDEIEKKIISKEIKTQQMLFLKWKEKINDYLKESSPNIEKLNDIYGKIIKSLKNTKIKKEIKEKLIENIKNIFENIKNQFSVEKIESLLKENEELKTKIDELEKKLNEKANIDDELKMKNNELDTVKEKLSAISSELNKSLKVIEEKNNEINQFQKQIDLFSKEKETQIKKLQEMEKNINEIKKAKDEITLQLEQLKTKLNDKEKDNWYKGEQIAKLENEKKALLAKISEIENALKTRNDEFYYLNENVNRFKDKIKLLNAEIEKLNKIITEKESYIRKCGSEIDKLKNEITLKDETIKNKEKEIENLNFKLSERDELVKNFKIDKNYLKDLLTTSYNKVLELIEYLDNLKDDFDYYENEIFNKYKENIIKNKNDYINNVNSMIKDKIMQIRKELNCKELYIHNDKSKKCEEHSKYCAKINKVEKVPKEFSEGDTIIVCAANVSYNISSIADKVINCIKETEVDIFKKDYTHFAVGSDIDASLSNIYITIRFIKLY